MLIFLSNLNMGASPVAAPVTVSVEDTGRDSGGGEPWWTGEWVTPPREPIPARAPVSRETLRPRITQEQRASLDESLQARVEAEMLRRDMGKMEAAGEAIAPALERAESRRAKQRLYNERSRLKRRKRELADEISSLETQAEQAAVELQTQEWLAFLRAEDEQFMRMVLELI